MGVLVAGLRTEQRNTAIWTTVYLENCIIGFRLASPKKPSFTKLEGPTFFYSR